MNCATRLAWATSRGSCRTRSAKRRMVRYVTLLLDLSVGLNEHDLRPTRYSVFHDLVAGMDSARKLEMISWAAAVASAATAAGLFYWSPPVDEDVSAIIVPFPQGLLLRSSF